MVPSEQSFLQINVKLIHGVCTGPKGNEYNRGMGIPWWCASPPVTDLSSTFGLVRDDSARDVDMNVRH